MGRIAVGFVALAGLACGDHAAAPQDAGGDSSKPEMPSALTLDIAVNGCAAYEAATVTCSGPAPLALAFAPVGSRELTAFQWDFGDGTAKTTDRAPMHTYGHPGRYTVTLRGGGADVGSTEPALPLTVQVEPLSAGAPCDVNEQCADNLACVCAPGTACGAAFATGICSASCAADACDPGAVCAALALDPPVNGAAARAPYCIAACPNSGDCAPGFTCQTVAAAGAAAAAVWDHGCLPRGAMRDVGEPCRDASERLADDLCTTGTCADLGALGVCSAPCDNDRPCPDAAACAVFPDGRRLCLLTCATDADCGDRDPLLACVAVRAPDGDATLVCSPKACVADSVCGPTGRCGPDALCVRK